MHAFNIKNKGALYLKNKILHINSNAEYFREPSVILLYSVCYYYIAATLSGFKTKKKKEFSRSRTLNSELIFIENKGIL